jgi:Flp pilus assembly protein TadB
MMMTRFSVILNHRPCGHRFRPNKNVRKSHRAGVINYIVIAIVIVIVIAIAIAIVIVIVIAIVIAIAIAIVIAVSCCARNQILRRWKL